MGLYRLRRELDTIIAMGEEGQSAADRNEAASSHEPQATPPAQLGKLLIEKGLIGPDQLMKAIKTQGDSGEYLGQILVENGFINEGQMISALSEQLE